jgi:putative membrane-bound dehydrogenase-like protein
MSKRILAGWVVLLCGVLLLACPPAIPQVASAHAADEGKKAPTTDVFGVGRVWSVHLALSAKEYDALQPTGGFTFPGAPPPPRPKDKRDRDRNLFGIEFPWVQGDVAVDGTTIRKVGLRYDGNATWFASGGDLRRPFRIDLDRHAKQDFHGLKTIYLHPGALDPARGREALAFAVLRAAGVPAPRTAFAEVFLTVPGRNDRTLLGLYSVVEPVDGRFVQDRFGSEKGLLMNPQRMRGIDNLGGDWQKYKDNYQPQSPPTREQSDRVIAFARLINEAGDAQFQKEIGSYLDLDGFLRFLAANALLSNLESFFALGHNYSLYLHPRTNRFIFLPSDMELALANFLMMGTAEQLMDLSIARPYPGPNRLADRLLVIKDVRDKYHAILKDLTATCFTKERLLKEVAAIEKVTKEPLAREAKAAAARRKGGFGPPPGMFGRPPDLRTFVEKRTASVAAQLAGKSKGYAPRFAFAPAPGPGPRATAPPVNDKTIHDLVKAPAEFQVTLFAAPPRVSYPVALAATPSGELFVAVDEQGSIGRNPGGGKILRCIDRDGDGKVDEVTVFARVEHPRGLVYQNGALWVLHPPLLSVFREGAKGTAPRQEVLVTGLTTEMINTRGGDHTTNGIRMGIDGWIYIAVGDYGCAPAKGKDGRTVTMRGGILRVRPDGTDLEVFATGLRNPFDIGIDPYLNLFTRDNDDNRPGGWDIRVSHLMQSAHYGYVQLYANFPEEIMPPLGQFGGGSGTGTLYLQHPGWPDRYRNVLSTADWGRSEIYRHVLRPSGPTFDMQQEVFLKVPRPTGMDIDGSGRLYVASWRGGEASMYVGPNVGFIARVVPRGLKPAALPNFREASDAQLLDHLTGPNTVAHLASQREVLRRGRKAETTTALIKRASDRGSPLKGRIAALFTLKQLDGKESHPALLKLVGDTSVREFALRALTDRKGELADLDTRPFVAALADESPRVRAQALISLGRLNHVAAAKSILPLTSRPKGSALPVRKPVHAQPDPDRVLPHLAVRALVAQKAAEACLEGLDGPHWQGALWALRGMHERAAVEGLIRKLGAARSTELRRGILAALIRLHHCEADYRGNWWGIRPENGGPYYDARPWQLTERIAKVLTQALLDGDAATAAFLRGELDRHRVSLHGVPAERTAVRDREEKPIVLPRADPANPDQIGNMTYEAAVKRALRAKGSAEKGKALFLAQSCAACHTYADGQAPRGPHLVDIGKRYSAAELAESILKPSEKIAQGFETYTFTMTSGRLHTGFIVSESAAVVQIREPTGLPRELKQSQIESREIQKQSMMPDGLASNLTPEQLADLIAYLQSLK